MKAWGWVGVLLLGVGLGLAQPSLDELRRQAQENQRLQQLQRQRIEQLNRELANLDAATQQQLAELRRLEGEITRLERERAELTRQIGLLEAQKEQAEARIAGLQKELEGLQARLSALLQSLHRERAGRYLPLLRAESFTDLAVRSRWVGMLGQHQTDLMERIRSTVRRLEEEQQRLELLVRTLTERRAERQGRIAALAQNRQAVRLTLARLQAQRAGRQIILRETLQAQAQLQAELRVLQGRISAELRRIAEERRREEERRRREAEERRRRELVAQRERELQVRREQEEVPVPRELVGALMFPLRGGRVAEAYGYLGNDWQTLQGDGPSSPIVAAADGVVMDSLFIANLGYTLTIRHSERMATQYVNVLEPQVAVGQRVSQGQLIGYTGGGVLIPSDRMWFRVIFIDENGNFRYVDPSRYY
ncbi:MAG: peptidoglycan DD-metalloendopeptidase family protein [Meiothermus sp.]|uniref:murein hydrolase activator EnvC family protein n=1 Tax=Meiothermus sp. TaxID=1955249 RepID=UPI0025EE6617|nr:peptidoglycan DD-metalloendopeptidase family protein [Meiothermus sp.]MCS7058909.1 peptidoglycan DD-metalloendopeptidase family protein [Meiothermus sp.]MCS7195080.1 peptidoglycan DD-metalloendopeptidase family protein [Meiothermus sp.]MCX7739761.1 peptidoglycan DD-metalloendopeptidase family protein [Meiothermus sp.]MDW8090126.1 peptidoglycan DD-metalloendopeptidase family protein [Meiothermus sp.]MDW8481429.1 peptidoglycan DD-metalloendopeptidase family protein [Meiothermus sp.]